MTSVQTRMPTIKMLVLEEYMKYIKISTLMLLSISMPVFSAGNFTTSITEVGVTLAGDYAYVNIDPVENTSTCTKHSQVRFELDSDSKRGALSLILAAKMAGKQVRFYFSDNDCLGDSPRPASVTVVDKN